MELGEVSLLVVSCPVAAAASCPRRSSVEPRISKVGPRMPRETVILHQPVWCQAPAARHLGRALRGLGGRPGGPAARRRATETPARARPGTSRPWPARPHFPESGLGPGDARLAGPPERRSTRRRSPRRPPALPTAARSRSPAGTAATPKTGDAGIDALDAGIDVDIDGPRPGLQLADRRAERLVVTVARHQQRRRRGDFRRLEQEHLPAAALGHLHHRRVRPADTRPARPRLRLLLLPRPTANPINPTTTRSTGPNPHPSTQIPRPPDRSPAVRSPSPTPRASPARRPSGRSACRDRR